ncbi:hypothetical protein [Halomonas sp.]|nr:hypothetical protein [Halomonas sp.]
MLASSLRDLYRQRRKAAEGAPDTRRLRDEAAEASLERGEPAPSVGERH